MAALATFLETVSTLNMPNPEGIFRSTYTFLRIKHMLATWTYQERTWWAEIECHHEIRGASAGQEDIVSPTPPEGIVRSRSS